ncbi:mitochondrial chaperonin of the DnaJ family [Suhomyces tanzawaensis NRRL Y-17324]|uniref:Mitochondrial chaperonin of the DnaJ family n=1 Tax=Suhomyces tanzawaensis NRRL Y-17324 TaxID=984487 RepID=A0A1E4SJU7_9ASCO|nr:mitochondrial chaperonin of the DnaJ family [Suhomyces tanzawaensis NRRL Y-17324]ODV79768.1 mitochondrial chaperonin of the DnaJ family [Suhomyces tanzawaensis NRRL Y-17324]
MVVPIIIGVGATMVALTVKSALGAYRQYIHLTPQMIATLNNITLSDPNDPTEFERHRHLIKDPSFRHHKLLKLRYPNRGFADPMTEQEALLVLGIEGDDIVNFNKNLLRKRYRQLMVLNHPDKKGSQYLSQRINQAKDVLEKSYMFRNDKS